MTDDLVERLRAITLRFASESPDDAVKRRNETARLAADRIETYMADADAHASRLDLVRRQEDEIRDLKAENAALRAEKAELRKATIEEAAAICERQAKYFRDLSNDPSCLSDIRWNSREEARHTMQSYAERHETDAAAIRNMGEKL